MTSILQLPDKEIENPSTGEIVNSIRDVYAKKIDYAALVIDRKENLFMQVSGDSLEYCAGVDGPIYKSSKVSPESAIKCFISCHKGDNLWQTMLPWEVLIKSLGALIHSDEKDGTSPLLQSFFSDAYEDKEALLSQRSYRDKVKRIVSNLMQSTELVQMGRNFIDSLPVAYFTDTGFIGRFDSLVISKYSSIGRLLLLYSIIYRVDGSHLFEVSDDYMKEAEKEFDIFDCNDDTPDFFLEELEMFTKVLKERNPEFDIYVAYDFVRNISVDHFSEKWEREYGQYFTDINELNVQSAIKRYCSIDTINCKDPDLAGIFVYYLIKHGKFTEHEVFKGGQQNYVECVVGTFKESFNKILESKKYKNFVNKLKTTSNKKRFTVNDVDSMDGQEFERFLAEMFSKKGYETELTKATGDQGIDVIISKDGSRVGVQAKCYSGTVGNSAIQEAVAGKSYYRLNKVMVVTNRLFTNSARKLAQANSVILWDRNILKEKIDEIFNSSEG